MIDEQLFECGWGSSFFASVIKKPGRRERGAQKLNLRRLQPERQRQRSYEFIFQNTFSKKLNRQQKQLI